MVRITATQLHPHPKDRIQYKIKNPRKLMPPYRNAAPIAHPTQSKQTKGN